jgi:hypothetical protein
MKPDESVRNALISEVIHQHFTTAHLAADILGKQGVEEAKEALRQALQSRDFFLCGKSMVALARIGDKESIAEIQAILEKTANPRLIIHAATALEIFQDIGSTELLLRKMEKRISDLVRDEIILALAGIWRMADWFYPLYTAFLENRSYGILRLKDTIAECVAKGKAPAADEELLAELADRVLQGDELAGFRQSLSVLLGKIGIVIDGTDLSAVLQKAAESENLLKRGRFRILLAAAVCWYAFPRP